MDVSQQWYVLRTIPEKEQEAFELLERSAARGLWTYCRILKKAKVFRSRGRLCLLEELMFPSYLFIETAHPEELVKELQKARKFPQPVGSLDIDLTPVEPADLDFLKNVCGNSLQNVMGITTISLDGDNHIVRADGILNHYKDRVVELNLRKRFALVEVKLFNRQQKVLFGVWLDKDQSPGGRIA